MLETTVRLTKTIVFFISLSEPSRLSIVLYFLLTTPISIILKMIKITLWAKVATYWLVSRQHAGISIIRSNPAKIKKLKFLLIGSVFCNNLKFKEGYNAVLKKKQACILNIGMQKLVFFLDLIQFYLLLLEFFSKLLQTLMNETWGRRK